MSFLVLYAFQWPIHRKTSRSHGAPNWTQVIGKSPGAFYSTTNPTILRFPALWKVSRENCNSISTITSEIKWYLMWDIWNMTLWHMIFDKSYVIYGWYLYTLITSYYYYWDTISIYFTHALKYSIPFSARTLASIPPCLGRWWKSNLRGVDGWTHYESSFCLQRSTESNCCVWLQKYVV